MLFGIVFYVLGYLKEYEFEIFRDLSNLENRSELDFEMLIVVIYVMDMSIYYHLLDKHINIIINCVEGNSRRIAKKDEAILKQKHKLKQDHMIHHHQVVSNNGKNKNNQNHTSKNRKHTSHGAKHGKKRSKHNKNGKNKSVGKNKSHNKRDNIIKNYNKRVMADGERRDKKGPVLTNDESVNVSTSFNDSSSVSVNMSNSMDIQTIDQDSSKLRQHSNNSVSGEVSNTLSVDRNNNNNVNSSTILPVKSTIVTVDSTKELVDADYLIPSNIVDSQVNEVIHTNKRDDMNNNINKNINSVSSISGISEEISIEKLRIDPPRNSDNSDKNEEIHLELEKDLDLQNDRIRKDNNNNEICDDDLDRDVPILDETDMIVFDFGDTNPYETKHPFDTYFERLREYWGDHDKYNSNNHNGTQIQRRPFAPGAHGGRNERNRNNNIRGGNNFRERRSVTSNNNNSNSNNNNSNSNEATQGLTNCFGTMLNKNVNNDNGGGSGDIGSPVSSGQVSQYQRSQHDSRQHSANNNHDNSNNSNTRKTRHPRAMKNNGLPQLRSQQISASATDRTDRNSKRVGSGGKNAPRHSILSNAAVLGGNTMRKKLWR